MKIEITIKQGNKVRKLNEEAKTFNEINNDSGYLPSFTDYKNVRDSVYEILKDTKGAIEIIIKRPDVNLKSTEKVLKNE